MITTNAGTYEKHPGTSGGPWDFRVQWNPFGDTEGIEQFLEHQVQGTRRIHMSDEMDIRCRVAYGIFRHANPLGLAEMLNTYKDFLGLVLFIGEQGIDTCCIYADAQRGEGTTIYGPSDKHDGKGRLFSIGYAGNTAISEEAAGYLGAALGGETFDDLGPLPATAARDLINAAQCCSFTGGSVNYKTLLVKCDGVEYTTVSLAGKTICEMGEFPSGVPRLEAAH